MRRFLLSFAFICVHLWLLAHPGPLRGSARQIDGLYVHNGMPSAEALESRWALFAKTEVADLTPSKKK